MCLFPHLRVRSLNELRVLLLDSPRHSAGMDRDLSRELHKAEWRVKEQKLQDDIKTLREKLLLLVSLHMVHYFDLHHLGSSKTSWLSRIL